MLKALSPVTTLTVGWVTGFSNPTTGMLVNILVITFGVLLSSIGEVTFAWDGFLFQIVATISESTRLTLIQWVLGMPTRQTTPDVEKDAAECSASKEDHGIVSDDENESDDGKDRDGNESFSSSSTATAIEEHDHTDMHDVDRKVGRYTDEEEEEFGMRTQEPLPVPEPEERSKEAEEVNGVAGMTPLVLLYYYAPVCAALNFCVALVAEAPRFDFDVFNHVSWGMLVLNGGVAFMLNVSSVFLVRIWHLCLSRP